MNRSSFRAGVLTVMAMPWLLACEAPLVLDGVEAQKAQPTQRSDFLQAIATNGNTAVAVGNRGVVVTSADQGKTCQRQVLDGQPFLLDISVCPDGGFVALASEQQVWIGNSSGSEWQLAAMETFETPQAVTCDPRGRIWVVGSFSSIIRSDDMGETWVETSMDEDLHFTSVQFLDDNNAILTGEFGAIVRTQDGGETWENLAPLEGEFYPQDAFFKDLNTGWIVGLTGTVLETMDGGASWSRVATGTDAPLYGVADGTGHIYAVGGYGTVLKRQADGSWSRIDHGQPVRFYLRGAAVLPDGRLLAAGGAGALIAVEL